MIAFNFAPRGWALCDGQIRQINTDQALFAILGTTYGGNGINTFALPDLRGRGPMHMGNGPGLTARNLGDVGGESTHVLSIAEIPAHVHQAFGRTAGTTGSPTGAAWADSGKPAYAAGGTDALAAAAVGATGIDEAHENMPPYLTINFAIALVGIFPSQP
jgi:microcystin-dependent protein